MSQLTGTVVIAQEGRLQVMDERGVSHLVILSHSAAAETWQLPPLQAGQSRVRVTYSDAPHVIGLKAEKIELLSGETTP
jgi:hypothetical protein